MHELSIIENTLEIALENAKNAGKIHWLKMRIGEISGVVPEALHFAFDVITKGTIAEGATLEIETVPVNCYCQKCELKFKPLDICYECPSCGNLHTQIITGKEIELTSLEVS